MAEEEVKTSGFSNLSRAFSEMPAGRKLLFLGAAALVVGGFLALMLWINRPVYQVLYSGLEQKDASLVVAKLKELKIPYTLEGNGQIIKVPEEVLYDTRLSLAEQGLPRGGGVGFEVFNQSPIGTTQFMQQVNYQRALQGELARTIASFSEIDDARVHIVMPRESLFVEEDKRPTASVVVSLASGRQLTKRQIDGIVYLVASAVPDLIAERVTLVDSRGNLIYRKEQDTEGFPAAMTASQLEYQKNVENTLKAKVQSMLEQVLGQGRAVVRVTADVDFTRTSTTERIFNPDQVAVRSETRSSEKSQGEGPGPTGSPDQRFALAARNATPAGEEQQAGSKSERENETTNFEISTTQKSSTSGVGLLNRLSVAVMIDGPYKEATGAEGQVTRSFTPRSAEEMAQLGQIVRRAVGYNEQRGDEISLVNVPFAAPEGMGVEAAKAWTDYLDEYGKTALNVFLVLLFFLMVVRPAMKMLAAKARPAPSMPARAVGPAEELPPGAEPEMPPELAAAMSVTGKMSTRDIILALSQQDPEKTTQVLRSWIHED